MTERERMDKILEELGKTYYYAVPQLNFCNPFELLVATILSAQCTDKQVNKVTAELFKKFPGPADFAALTPEELEPHVKSCGFYRNKAKNIVAAAQMILSDFGGKVPDNIEDMQKLPGVGRKTANVVLANAFHGDAIAVDTHVYRVTNRLGLADAKDVWHTEQQLMENIPKEEWSAAHHWLIYHGRQVCSAQRPKCDVCTLKPYCKHPGAYYKASGKTKKEKQA